MAQYLPLRRLPVLVVVALAVAAGFAAGSILTASGAPSSTTIHACVNRYNGDMRMARSPGRCASTEYAVSWESYSAANLDSEYVNESQADSITSPMIVDGDVGNTDLAADSVTGDKVLDGTLGAADLGTDSVGADEIQSDAVSSDELADDSVTSSHIVDGSVANADLAAGSVTTDKIQDGTVSSSDLGTGSVGSDEIQSDAVTGNELATDSVNSTHVVNGSLTADDLGTDSVGAAEIQANAVAGIELAGNSVTSGHIVNGTIAQGDLDSSLVSFIDGQSVGDGQTIPGGYEIKTASTTIPPNGDGEVTAPCSPGKVVIGGGGDSNALNVSPIDSYPSGNSGWYVDYDNFGSETVTITAYAICTNP